MPDVYSEIDETQGIPASTEWELENKDILKGIEESLGGKWYELSKDGQSIVEKYDPDLALINNKGLMFLKSRILLIANKWTALSVSEKDEIKKFILFFSDALRMELRARKDEFEVKRHNFESLILAFSQFCYLALSRSIDQGERKYRKGVERRITSFIEGGKRGIRGAVTGLFTKKREPYNA